MAVCIAMINACSVLASIGEVYSNAHPAVLVWTSHWISVHFTREIGFERVIGLDIDPDSVQQASLRYEAMNVDRDHFQVDFLCSDLTRTIFPNYSSACDSTTHECFLNFHPVQNLLFFLFPDL